MPRITMMGDAIAREGLAAGRRVKAACRYMVRWEGVNLDPSTVREIEPARGWWDVSWRSSPTARTQHRAFRRKDEAVSWARRCGLSEYGLTQH
jgi:hypothetical protein